MAKTWEKYSDRVELFLLIAVALMVYIKGGWTVRTFWPYMLSAYLMGAWAYIQQFQSVPAGEKPPLHGFLFPKKIWMHRSSLNDCAISLINLHINLFLGVAVLYLTGFNLGVVLRLISAAGHYLPDWRPAGEPGIGVLAAYSLFVVLLQELFYYISHRLSHEIPVLWEFHKIHHSAKVMTPLTLYRAHPVDLWLNNLFVTVGFGIGAVVFIHFYPGIKNAILAMEVNLLIVMFNLFGANLRHSHIWISFGPVVERVLISPAQHQIHHSENPRHFNKNYGAQLAIWDWAFGSLYVPKGREEITIGLGSEKEDAHYHSLWGIYVQPLKTVYERATGKSGHAL